jgi:hypothetical protein
MTKIAISLKKKPAKIKSLLKLHELEEKANCLCIEKNSLVNAWSKGKDGNGMEKAAKIREKEKVLLTEVRFSLLEKMAELTKRIGDGKEKGAVTDTHTREIDMGTGMGKLKWTIQRAV